MRIIRYTGEIDGFIEGSRRVTHEKVTTVHKLSPAEIDIRESKAVSESFCEIISRFEHQGAEYDKITTCRLISKLEKLGSLSSAENLWKMITLEPIYIRDSFVPATPIPSDRCSFFDGLEKFPRSYRHGAWLLASLGIPVQHDLPSEDNREAVQRIFDNYREWLEAS